MVSVDSTVLLLYLINIIIYISGNKCLSRCNTYCLNGARVDQSTCSCKCNSRQTDENCKCKANFTGVNCNTCKTTLTCTGNKHFDTRTCACECPRGFSGANCQSELPLDISESHRREIPRRRIENRVGDVRPRCITLLRHIRMTFRERMTGRLVSSWYPVRRRICANSRAELQKLIVRTLS